MAVTLDLIRKEDEVATTSTLHLIGGTDGVDLDYDNGWIPAIARGNSNAPLPETINLIISGDDADDLAANVQGLDDKIKEAAWYLNDSQEFRPLWLVAQLSAETGQRKALIYELDGQIGESILGPYTDAQSVMRRYTLGLLRGPWWETTSNATSRTISLPNVFGQKGNVEQALGIPGDVPVRIVKMAVNGVNGGGGPMTEFWFGFRSSRFGTAADFQAVWDLGDPDATFGTATVRFSPDGSAYGSQRATVSYQGNDDDLMNTRVTLITDDVTLHPEDQRGSYIILCRAKVTSGEWRIRLQDAPEGADDDTWRTQDRVSITSTTYYVYELGTIRLPPQRWSGTEYLDKYAMRIQAELVSGIGDLHLDALSLIPYGEGAIYMHINGTGVQYSSGDLDPAIIRTYSNDEVEGWWYDDDNPAASIDVKALNWGLPCGDSCYIIATGQRATWQVLTDDISVDIYFYPRWRTLRGAD